MGLITSSGRVYPEERPPSEVAEIARWTMWHRFQDVELEADFTQDLCRGRRKGSVLMLWVSVALYVLEFVVLASRTIGNGQTATKVMIWFRVFGFLTMVSHALLVTLDLVNIELASISAAIILALSFLFTNKYRMALIMGDDIQEAIFRECDAVICYDDTFFVLGLAGVCTASVGFAAARASRSWIVVFSTVLTYGLGSSFGLSPHDASRTWAVGILYTCVVMINFSRNYYQEEDARKKWLDNRRLRLEVQRQSLMYEEQQRWLEEVNERLEALGNPQESIPTPTKPSASDEDTLTSRECTYMVPAIRDFPADITDFVLEDVSPNELLSRHMRMRRADRAAVQRIATRIREPQYNMREYYHDCLAAFPELELFFVAGSECGARKAHIEYQRTFGALFAVYWLLRLDTDGKYGFSFGCDEDWNIRRSPVGAAVEKRQDFFDHMDWSLLREVSDRAVGTSLERTEAMLCLTAFHDVMKVSALVPRVSAAHAPYHGYHTGDEIHDHDVALAYILENYPHLMPSFQTLQKSSRDLVIFSQTEMGFNHGWFVQAEGPPGAMLSKLKHVLRTSSGADISFYFFHWLTDISGAEGRPLAGAEKLSRRFPRTVLVTFLWSMPYLQHLADRQETEVVESYLEDRFSQSFPAEPLPDGSGAIAALRLAVMAQGGARLALDAFRQVPPAVRHVLSNELALTGIVGQTFRRSPVSGGPAFLVYYAPAVLQRCHSATEMQKALTALAAVFAAGRKLWPKEQCNANQTVTLQVGRLQGMDIGCSVASDVAEPQIWALVRLNDCEAKLDLVSAAGVNNLILSRAAFVCVSLGFTDESSSAVVSEP